MIRRFSCGVSIGKQVYSSDNHGLKDKQRHFIDMATSVTTAQEGTGDYFEGNAITCTVWNPVGRRVLKRPQ